MTHTARNIGTHYHASSQIDGGAPAHTILSATHTDTTPDTVVRGDLMAGIGASPTWTRLAISVPSANQLNVLGAANGDTEPAYKLLLDATAPGTISAGASASAGTSLKAAHVDHTHGAPSTYPATAHNLLSATHGDSTAASAVRGDIVTAQGASPTWKRLAASVPAANVLTVLGFANGDTEPAWKTVLDAIAPTTSALGDAAAAGTSLVFAHRDHAHGRESFANPTGSIGLTAVNGTATTPMRSDAAPALSQAIAPTWTGPHAWTGGASTAPIIITTGALAAGSPSIIIRGVNNTERVRVESYGASVGPHFDGIGAGGTVASPTHTLNGTQIWGANGGGYDNAGTPAAHNQAQILMMAAEDWTTTALGTFISLKATAPTTTTLTEVERIVGAGVQVAGYLSAASSIAAPSNTTAGDLTAIRAFFSGNLDLSAGITGSGLTWSDYSFNAADFTATGATWTVGSGDITRFRYQRMGKTLFVDFSIDTTTLSAGTGTLSMPVPGGFTISSHGPYHGFGWALDNGATGLGLRFFGAANATTLTIQRLDLGNFTACTDALYVQGHITLEIA